MLISILLHGLIGWWLLSQDRIQIAEKSENDHAAIKAKLIFFPKPKPPEDLTEIEQRESPPSIDETNEEVEQIQQPILSEQKEQVIDEVIDSAPQEEQLTKEETAKDQLPAIDYPPIEKTENANQKQSNTPIMTSRDLAQKHLQNYSAQANQRLAEQEAQRYRQQKNSPDLNLPEIDPFKTEDEKLIESNTIRVDCSSTVNKTLLTVLRFTSGTTMDCSKQSDLAPYIDKHVKKPLPADNHR